MWVAWASPRQRAWHDFRGTASARRPGDGRQPGRAAAVGRAADQALWHADRLCRRLVHPLAGRGHGHRRRKRVGQVDASCMSCRSSRPRRGPRAVSHTGGLARHAGHGRARAAAPGAHRLGLCPSEPARRPADERQRGWKRRRAADGRGGAELRRDPRAGAGLAGAGRDRGRPDRRPAERLFPAGCSSACRSRATW